MEQNNLTISSKDVHEFKTVFCDENSIIRNILSKEFREYFEGKILDVGGGTSDILSEVIPEENVIHLDILDFSKHPIPKKHERIQGDFLDSDLVKSFLSADVLFMSHVMQFIDGDMEKLQEIINQINAKRIIMVEDVNDDFLGEVMNYSLDNFENANPEFKRENFPKGYKKTKSKIFTAKLTCEDFRGLANQCLYLMDLEHSSENIKKMEDFLRGRLTSPEFTINQEINLYEK